MLRPKLSTQYREVGTVGAAPAYTHAGMDSAEPPSSSSSLGPTKKAKRKKGSSKKRGSSKKSSKSSGKISRTAGGLKFGDAGEHARMDELKTIYEGSAGPRSSRMLHKTTVIVTNKTVEIEREGANVFLTFLTLGCWYFCFQTASIEIYELTRITSLYLKDDVIVGEFPSRGMCTPNHFIIDLPARAGKTTQDLFFEMKEVWSKANNFGDKDDAEIDMADDEDDDLIVGSD